ncbi:Piso0_000454 [Millerozyma farinosa CBS 7064]|uniref:Piso0_000454 protein n=1 Tax=Pichia sorbitophila (strain ATCC MYA-4447 / BCRC 22081 / CBS 7064 / NBRC 10061 / NRRL Y-12695) TaxID=559304 RepID=G8YVH2_PICSO|nr:Piso0_000454 [Millerozyma farinosa CBS 7064]CCE73416.1 Piso0_000454 [Millerozyma farinosa CBS 7064]
MFPSQIRNTTMLAGRAAIKRCTASMAPKIIPFKESWKPALIERGVHSRAFQHNSSGIQGNAPWTAKRFKSDTVNAKRNKSNKKQKLAIQGLSKSSPNQRNENANLLLQLLDETAAGNKVEALEKHISPATAITIGENICLEKAAQKIDGRHLWSNVLPEEVINVKFNDHDVMILSNGTVVGWGVDEQTLENELIKYIQPAVNVPCTWESDEVDWIQLPSPRSQEYSELTQSISSSQGKGPSRDSSYMQGDIMVIVGRDENEVLLHKAAFAIGFSRSTRLSVLESALENHIQLTRANSERMSRGEQIHTREADVLRLTGRLFLLRGKLNFYSELIETPDVYWTEPNLEKIYESISRSLDITPRISILNRKLDYATEEQRALLSVLTEKKSTRLEWIIIVLIMVEVCFEIFHFYERSLESSSEKRS